MIEVYVNGVLKYQRDSHGSDEIMVLPKRIADSCVMTAKSFDELFYKILEANFPHATNLTHEQAYNKAERMHEEFLGKRRYKDFESFRKSRDQRINGK